MRSRRLLGALVLGLVSILAAYAANLPVTAVKASGSVSGNTPDRAVDGNPSSWWTCDMSVAPCWIRLDLGASKSISRVLITWHNGASRKNFFSIGVAGDDFNYKTVFAGASAGNTNAAETYSFTTISGRYVKITVTDDSTHDGRASITETSVGGPLPASATPTPTDAGQRDAFGIAKKYASAPGGPLWTSAHWANNHIRNIVGRDPDDPTGASESRSDQATLYVDGQGILQFKGSSSDSEPRLHLNGGPSMFFQNVEITYYYQKGQDFDVNWGGMVIGARSGPEGHSQSSQFCDAHTYYGRLRNDGTYDFEKELKHPASSIRSGGNIWGGSTDIPPAKWIGMKYVVYNTMVSGKQSIKLELYRDMTGGTNGGTWDKIGETVDSGGWSPPQSSTTCSYPRDYIPIPGGGVIVLRNTGVIKESYKWMSAREIAPPAS